MKTDDLIAEATSLPVEDRVLVADCILRSLNPPQSDVDQKWAAVAKRRLAELQAGQAQSARGEEERANARRSQCLACQCETATQGKRICPLCRHEFQGNGWDGVDAHWRAKHESVMPYERFWSSLCPAHRGEA